MPNGDALIRHIPALSPIWIFLMEPGQDLSASVLNLESCEWGGIGISAPK